MSDPGVLSDDDKAALKPLYDRLAALRSRAERVGHWAPNKRYVIDFDMLASEIPFSSLGGTPANPLSYKDNHFFALRENQTVIDRSVIFLCEEIEVIISIIGTSVATGMPATFVIPPPWRSQFLDFYLRFQDTGSDREWQNDWLPGNAFQSANLGGLILGDEGHILVSGGAAVTASLQIVQSGAAASALTGLTDIVSFQLKASLIGCHVSLESA